jgi:hypothetical protein
MWFVHAVIEHSTACVLTSGSSRQNALRCKISDEQGFRRVNGTLEFLVNRL